MKVRFSMDTLHTLRYGISWFQDYASVLARCLYFKGQIIGVPLYCIDWGVITIIIISFPLELQNFEIK